MTPTPFEQRLGPPQQGTASARSPEPDRREGADDAERLHLRIARPEENAILLTASGEVDETTIPRFREVLLPRLSATALLLVVDLGGVEFLNVTGLELLRYAHSHARNQGMLLRLVVSTRAVRRAVWQAELDSVLEIHPTVTSALARVPEASTPEVVSHRNTTASARENPGGGG
ncbi:anti-sigma factor antagonist [Actinopolyspora erythraea]|uniref:Anti-sigma factor antagonist n=1 Tax=Actinopolyspora erythraea TaxID=414996 RepID=A0A223RST4_9ACTN|nr:STAS domain-containing protein [Actinopolyspora erythraea]ASU78910.1 anti-sigma factor antagonist [Actinopolyspora erythraea]